MNDDHEVMKNNVLEIENIDASENLENLVHLPLTAELLVVSNESPDVLNSTKLNLQTPTFLNVGSNYILTSLKGGQNLSGKTITLDNGRSSSVAFLEPPTKKQKFESDDVKKMLVSIQHTILERLVSIEKNMEKITTKCQCLEEKFESMFLKNNVSDFGSELPKKGRYNDLLSGVVTECSGDASFYSPLTALNTEDAYPEGSWLGNPENEAFRVRCPISAKELVSVNETCTTPVKMALTLLDYLFDRETQACSNISGVGKHGKLQLDPVKIFGIRCHLMYTFGVTEEQWRRIKLNLDSKCRSAFRRKQKGMPLSIKGFRNKPNQEYEDLLVKDENRIQPNALSLLSELDSPERHSTLITLSEQDSPSDSTDSLVCQEDPHNMEIARIIETDQGDIHVIQTTLEQLVQLKDNQVEILTVTSTQARH